MKFHIHTLACKIDAILNGHLMYSNVAQILYQNMLYEQNNLKIISFSTIYELTIQWKNLSIKPITIKYVVFC